MKKREGFCKVGGKWHVQKLKEKKYMQGVETQVKTQCLSLLLCKIKLRYVLKPKVKAEKRKRNNFS